MSFLKLGQSTGRTRYRQAWYGRMVLQLEYWGLDGFNAGDVDVVRMWRDVRRGEVGDFTIPDSYPKPVDLLGWAWIKFFPIRHTHKKMSEEMKQDELELLYVKAEDVIRTDLAGHNLAGGSSKCVQAMATQYSRFKNANQ